VLEFILIREFILINFNKFFIEHIDLWNDCAGKRHLHLCSWQAISRPRKQGGWGLRNLTVFNTALLACSFWRAITFNNIWHRVIIDKYLGSFPLLRWLRKPSFELRRASPIWKGLINASPVILHWLRWKPGTGSDIQIGRDKVLGLGNFSILSPSLRSQLSLINLSTLAQAQGPSVSPIFPGAWIHSSDLFLQGQFAAEWDDYTTALKSAGVVLSNSPDYLLWAGGDESGLLNVKNAYVALRPPLANCIEAPWLHSIWDWSIPLKIRIFCWLCVNQKPLTWEALQNRGWQGPGRCPLCMQNSEDLNHLLIHCPFTVFIWTAISQHFSLQSDWKGASLNDCYSAWYSVRSAPLQLAAIVCWAIWIERNHAIFENRPPSRPAVLHRILTSFHWRPSSIKPIQNRACVHQLAKGYTLICFDGAAQQNGLCCGAGGTFRSSLSRTSNWSLNCGSGSNTKAELMGLWVSLSLATFWSLDHILVLGDSKIIIDWINRHSKLHAVHIEGWKERTMKLSSNFSDIEFRHIPRSHNIAADALSKKALIGVVGRLSVYHVDNGVESPTSYYNLFEG
jgi:ribonuclease HI